MKKRILAMLLCLSMMTALLSVGASADEGKKHVDVLRIGTTYANDTFSVFSQGGAMGRVNYNCFVNLNFWAFDENGELSADGYIRYIKAKYEELYAL